jgi:hypothetical protein
LISACATLWAFRRAIVSAVRRSVRAFRVFVGPNSGVGPPLRRLRRIVSRVGKAQILDDLREARQQPPAPAWEKLKKSDLATLAEREIAGTRWLPMPLRPKR